MPFQATVFKKWVLPLKYLSFLRMDLVQEDALEDGGPKYGRSLGPRVTR